MSDSIPIQNIYYMLSYAFQVLKEQGYRDVATESFRNVADLCAAILARGVAVQVKRGLGREYIEQTEELSTLRGRIDLAESVRTMSLRRQKLVCSYDEFSVNGHLNRILKTTMGELLHANIPQARKAELRKLLLYFGGVETMEVDSINWRIPYNRNNQTYQMLIAICYLVIKGLLQTQEAGRARLMDFLDEQRMSHLYEKFILAYYKREYPELMPEAPFIDWVLDESPDTASGVSLPKMKSDIVLTYGNKVLIIDAKYYSRSTVSNYGREVLRSANLYQIFTYVKNRQSSYCDDVHEVSGLLLYARTNAEVQPDNTFSMSGNTVSAKNLDLNCDFKHIAAQLDRIASGFRG